ncbi:MAG: chloramphenicol acetyltransferase [Elusimicrobia bacterium]|nr:chloramphenicol acetyltransferase [Elusimicrobiota bacterium]
MVNYKIINMNEYYRKDVFRHFAQTKCSISMTSRIDVQPLYDYSKKTNTKFYINFLYLLSKTLNSREDYRLAWLHQTSQLIVYDKINPTQYIFHEDTETCTPVYTVYDQDYKKFYQNASKDIETAKKTHGYGLDMLNHPNWFDASYMSWISYDSLNVELPDGYLFFMPIINWGRYREENGRLVMPVTVRLNHASADGYLVAQVYKILEKEIKEFCK